MNFIVVKNLFSTKSLFHFREFKKREREREIISRNIEYKISDERVFYSISINRPTLLRVTRFQIFKFDFF